MSYNAQIFDDSLISNPAPRCPVMLVMDASSSMSGAPNNELNLGLTQFVEEVQADEMASCSVEAGVISFGHTVELVQPMKTVDDIEVLPKIDAYGMTPMGEAVELAIDTLEARKQEYKQSGVSYYQPWLVLMTDGEPNDEWRAAARRLKQLAENKKMVVLCVGIGDDADMQVLQEFSALEPKKLKGLEFRAFFQWLSASMQRVSQSIPGDKVALPPTSGWDAISV